MKRAFSLIVLSVSLTLTPAVAQQHKAAISLEADRHSYAPGSRVQVAAVMTVEEGWHVNSNTPTYDYLIPTELRLTIPSSQNEPEIVYPAHSMQKFAFTEEPIAVYDGISAILASFDLDPSVLDSADIEAVLRYQACDHQQCLPPVDTSASLSITIGSEGNPTASQWFGAAQPPSAQQGPNDEQATASTFLLMLLMAMVGGLILNAMPCVLPVLSIKLFGLVKSSAHGRSALVAGCLATTAGILLSFWVLALAAVAASRAGAAVGWGIQFQEPGFVAFLAVVVVLFSLNMWGLFEIGLPGSVARAVGTNQREGVAGHLASGLFATLMATPCSAPFLGTAIGFALGQPAWAIFAIFSAVGIGLALPYLLLAAVPSLAGFLPKPGAWMVTLRQAMGFLLAAAAVWLFYVLAAQISPEALAAVQLSLLSLSLAVWLAGRTSGWQRRAATFVGIALAVGTVGIAAGAPSAGTIESKNAGLIEWLSFDEDEATRLASTGHLVFVDVTADWCLTCKANERLVIETEDVANAFDRLGVVAMKADWTNRDDRITAFLRQYGRSAVPFYILFRPGDEPFPFGELLSKRTLLETLETAAGRAQEQMVAK